MTDHPRAVAAQYFGSPKVAARASGLTISECRAMFQLRSDRMMARLKGADPLIMAQRSRAFRTAGAIRAGQERVEAAKAARANEARRLADAEALGAAISDTLKSAARTARSMGWKVRASTSRSGRISSYYVRPPCGPEIRISDHEIPANAKREMLAEVHGRSFYDGYHGPQLLIDAPHSPVWCRRMLVLIAAGRR
jgi:hypothetical protein